MPVPFILFECICAHVEVNMSHMSQTFRYVKNEYLNGYVGCGARTSHSDEVNSSFPNQKTQVRGDVMMWRMM